MIKQSASLRIFLFLVHLSFAYLTKNLQRFNRIGEHSKIVMNCIGMPLHVPKYTNLCNNTRPRPSTFIATAFCQQSHAAIFSGLDVFVPTEPHSGSLMSSLRTQWLATKTGHLRSSWVIGHYGSGHGGHGVSSELDWAPRLQYHQHPDSRQ